MWLVCLQIALDNGQKSDWFNSPKICWMLGLSIFAMIAFVVSQLKNSKSLIDLKVFKDKNFAFGTKICYGFNNGCFVFLNCDYAVVFAKLVEV